MSVISDTRATHAAAGAIAFSLLLLTGCHIPKLRYAEQGPALPADFDGQTSTENSAHVGIAEFFNDPVLAGLVSEGLACNQELKILEQEIQVASNEVQARRGAYLPFVSLGAGGGVDRHSLYTPLGAAEEQLETPRGGHFPDPLPNVKVAANLFWQVDIWRELRNARDAAAQRYQAALEHRNYFVTRLVAEIAETYYELAALDRQLENLNQIIELQNQSLKVAEANKAAARGTELGVQRFLAEVHKNESERLIVRQKIIEAENRINFLVGRYPQDVERTSWDFITLDSRALCVGVPSQLLQNRRDIREAERELIAAGLDIKVAKARFFPRLDITAGIGFEAFNPRYLFTPDALIANAAGELVAPLINKKAIQAEYRSANARQLQAVYNYQRVVLNAFTEVVNRVNKAENYRQSVEIKTAQLAALEESVDVAMKLFQLPIPGENTRVDYMEVLLAQRDLLEARNVLIETKQQQLSAIVNAYQALGGGCVVSTPVPGLAVLPPGGGANVPPAPAAPPAAPAVPPATPVDQPVTPPVAPPGPLEDQATAVKERAGVARL